MIKQSNRWIAISTLGVMTASTFGGLGMTAVHAGSKSKRNLAIGLGAVTAYGLLKKKKTVAIVGGVGTALAYHSYKKSRKKEKVQEARRIEWYKQRYGRFWRNYYKPGA